MGIYTIESEKTVEPYRPKNIQIITLYIMRVDRGRGATCRAKETELRGGKPCTEMYDLLFHDISQL